MKHILTHGLLLGALTLPAVGSLTAAEQTYTLSSPDGHLTVEITSSPALTYRLLAGTDTLLTDSRIGLTLDDGTVIGGNGCIIGGRTSTQHEDITAPLYRQRAFSVDYNELHLTLENGFGLTFRAYPEGVAYRFTTSRKRFTTVKEEQAEFRFPADYTVTMAHTTHAEHPFAMAFQNTYSETPLSTANTLPAFLPASVDCGTHRVTLMEADLEAYPGMFVQSDTLQHALHGVFAPYPAQTDYYPWRKQLYVTQAADFIARSSGARTYPWRVMAVTTDDAQLPVNNLVYALASPNRIGDTAWIPRGKVAWDWWNDWNLKGVPFKAGINMDTYKYYIDFAAKAGLEYVVLDEGWYDPKSGDMLTVISELNLEELVAYGKERNVGLWLWTVFNVLDDQLEAACKKYAAMGIKGFKVDFLDRDDQTAVEMAYRIAEGCARHRLALDYHGFYKPTGLNRTYPNVINFESVFGMEEVKWGDPACDMPRYDVTFPFLRMALGPVDYTPGALRNGTRSNWRAIYDEPMSKGTRCHQLASYIVHDSPFTMLCDAPSQYLKEMECVEFIASLPVEADSTFIASGRMGEHIVTVRRHGSNWYMGGLTNWESRDVTLDFSFLPEGHRYRATLFADGLNADKNAEDYRVITFEVKRGDKRIIHLASGGGFAMKMYRAN
jgi:alpha-glucosidase